MKAWPTMPIRFMPLRTSAARNRSSAGRRADHHVDVPLSAAAQQAIP